MSYNQVGLHFVDNELIIKAGEALADAPKTDLPPSSQLIAAYGNFALSCLSDTIDSLLDSADIGIDQDVQPHPVVLEILTGGGADLIKYVFDAGNFPQESLVDCLGIGAEVIQEAATLFSSGRGGNLDFDDYVMPMLRRVFTSKFHREPKLSLNVPIVKKARPTQTRAIRKKTASKSPRIRSSTGSEDVNVISPDENHFDKLLQQDYHLDRDAIEVMLATDTIDAVSRAVLEEQLKPATERKAYTELADSFKSTPARLRLAFVRGLEDLFTHTAKLGINTNTQTNPRKLLRVAELFGATPAELIQALSKLADGELDVFLQKYHLDTIEVTNTGTRAISTTLGIGERQINRIFQRANNEVKHLIIAERRGFADWQKDRIEEYGLDFALPMLGTAQRLAVIGTWTLLIANARTRHLSQMLFLGDPNKIEISKTQLAAELNVSRSTITSELIRGVSHLQKLGSLVCSNAGSVSLKPSQVESKSSIVEDVIAAVPYLADYEQFVVIRTFGLDGNPQSSPEELANELNVGVDKIHTLVANITERISSMLHHAGVRHTVDWSAIHRTGFFEKQEQIFGIVSDDVDVYIADINDLQASVVNAMYVEGMTSAQTAELIGKTERATKAIYRRGMQRIKHLKETTQTDLDDIIFKTYGIDRSAAPKVLPLLNERGAHIFSRMMALNGEKRIATIPEVARELGSPVRSTDRTFRAVLRVARDELARIEREGELVQAYPPEVEEFLQSKYKLSGSELAGAVMLLGDESEIFVIRRSFCLDGSRRRPKHIEIATELGISEAAVRQKLSRGMRKLTIKLKEEIANKARY